MSPFIDDVQDKWQQVRIPVILGIVMCLAVLRVYLHYTDERPGLKAFPERFAADKSSPTAPQGKKDA